MINFLGTKDRKIRIVLPEELRGKEVTKSNNEEPEPGIILQLPSSNDSQITPMDPGLYIAMLEKYIEQNPGDIEARAQLAEFKALYDQ